MLALAALTALPVAVFGRLEHPVDHVEPPWPAALQFFAAAATAVCIAQVAATGIWTPEGVFHWEVPALLLGLIAAQSWLPASLPTQDRPGAPGVRSGTPQGRSPM